MVKDFKNKTDVPLSQKTLILEQIQNCNRIISGFASSPRVVDAKIDEYDFMEASQSGKRIANAVLDLEANVYPLMSKQWIDRRDIEMYRDKAFLSVEKYNDKYFPKKEVQQEDNEGIVAIPLRGGIMGKRTIGKRYMNLDLEIQQEGIEYIIDYYRQLLAFIFSLAEFKEIKTVSENIEEPEEEDFETD